MFKLFIVLFLLVELANYELSRFIFFNFLGVEELTSYFVYEVLQSYTVLLVVNYDLAVVLGVF